MSKDRPPPFSSKPHSVEFGSIPEDKVVHIQECLYQGEKIQAVKIYRECTGESLAVSKATVEHLEGNLRKGSPEKFTASVPNKRGCLIVMISLGVVVVVAAIIVLIVSK